MIPRRIKVRSSQYRQPGPVCRCFVNLSTFLSNITETRFNAIGKVVGTGILELQEDRRNEL